MPQVSSCCTDCAATRAVAESYPSVCAQARAGCGEALFAAGRGRQGVGQILGRARWLAVLESAKARRRRHPRGRLAGAVGGDVHARSRARLACEGGAATHASRFEAGRGDSHAVHHAFVLAGRRRGACAEPLALVVSRPCAATHRRPAAAAYSHHSWSMGHSSRGRKCRPFSMLESNRTSSGATQAVQTLGIPAWRSLRAERKSGSTPARGRSTGEVSARLQAVQRQGPGERHAVHAVVRARARGRSNSWLGKKSSRMAHARQQRRLRCSTSAIPPRSSGSSSTLTAW